MDQREQNEVRLLNAISPRVLLLLTVGLAMTGLYFSESFGESIGKAIYYLTH